MTNLNLKCPSCGYKGEIEVNTGTEEQTRFQCPRCGQQGNRKLFEIKSNDSVDTRSNEVKNNDFWT
jgi:transposase-like protein